MERKEGGQEEEIETQRDENEGQEEPRETIGEGLWRRRGNEREEKDSK